MFTFNQYILQNFKRYIDLIMGFKTLCSIQIEKVTSAQSSLSFGRWSFCCSSQHMKSKGTEILMLIFLIDFL